MADKSAIEWTDATWNPIVGCSIVSPGCTNCYAMKMAARIERMGGAPHYDDLTQGSKAGPVWTGKVALAPDHILTAPLRWKRGRRIFVNSMGDLFHESIPDEWIDRVFAVMALSPQHTFQVLTKRAERMRAYLTARNGMGNAALCDAINKIPAQLGNRHGALEMPLPNVWLGVSTERQQEADERIPLLLQTPAAVWFISAEPLLGPIDLTPKADAAYQRLSEWYGPKGFDPEGSQPRRERVTGYFPRLDWVIVGGESGPGARPMHPDWARSLRDQCAAADVPFFFKQWGRYSPQHDGPEERFFACLKDGEPDHAIDKGWCFGKLPTQRPWMMFDLGKKASGRLLDGKEHNEFPTSNARANVA